MSVRVELFHALVVLITIYSEPRYMVKDGEYSINEHECEDRTEKCKQCNHKSSKLEVVINGTQRSLYHISCPTLSITLPTYSGCFRAVELVEGDFDGSAEGISTEVGRRRLCHRKCSSKTIQTTR